MSKIRFGKKTRAIREFAESLGYSYEFTNSSHIKFTHPEAPCVFTSSTPSDRRVLMNAKKQLERNLRLARERAASAGEGGLQVA